MVIITLVSHAWDTPQKRLVCRGPAVCVMTTLNYPVQHLNKFPRLVAGPWTMYDRETAHSPCVISCSSAPRPSLAFLWENEKEERDAAEAGLPSINKNRLRYTYILLSTLDIKTIDGETLHQLILETGGVHPSSRVIFRVAFVVLAAELKSRFSKQVCFPPRKKHHKQNAMRGRHDQPPLATWTNRTETELSDWAGLHSHHTSHDSEESGKRCSVTRDRSLRNLNSNLLLFDNRSNFVHGCDRFAPPYSSIMEKEPGELPKVPAIPVSTSVVALPVVSHELDGLQDKLPHLRGRRTVVERKQALHVMSRREC